MKIWFEILFYKILSLFGFRLDQSKIPEGLYCYTPLSIKGMKMNIKPCPYYRSTIKYNRRIGIACTFTRFYGYDTLLCDQCKICEINLGMEELNED